MRYLSSIWLLQRLTEYILNMGSFYLGYVMFVTYSPRKTNGSLLGLTRFGIFYRLRGEGNSTPLQYSCLENPMDGGAW